jgi:hypothetical protein
MSRSGTLITNKEYDLCEGFFVAIFLASESGFGSRSQINADPDPEHRVLFDNYIYLQCFCTRRGRFESPPAQQQDPPLPHHASEPGGLQVK